MHGAPIITAAESLASTARTQARVVGALVMREMHTRFGRENLGYVWLFLEPMILAGCVALLHQVSGHGLPGGLPIFTFYIISYTPHYLLRSILNRAPTALEANQSLFYHARVTLVDVLLARTLLEVAAVMIAVAVFLTGVAVVTGVWPHDPVLVGVGLLLMGLLVHGGAMLICASTVLGAHNVDRVVHPFTYLIIPFSGAFFMVWWLPKQAQEWLLLMPTAHVYEFMREAAFGPVVPYHYDLAYLGTCILVVNVAGLLALRAARRHLEF